jgi:hypothetical protein
MRVGRPDGGKTVATDASKRGWGDPGVPGSLAARDYARKHIITVNAGGIRLPVRREVAPIFEAFVNEIASRGYSLSGVADDWGYACRYIRGLEAKRVFSNHAWGLAVDLNATRNPMTSDGKVHTDMPGWVVTCASAYGLEWGGNYRGARKDPMHFEFLGSPADAARLAGSPQVAHALSFRTPGSGGDDSSAPKEDDDDMRGVLMRIEGQSEVWCVTPLGRWHVPDPETMNLLRFVGVVRPVEGVADDVAVVPAIHAKALEGIPKVVESIP